MLEGKKINELPSISTISDETVVPAVYVNNGSVNSEASKVSIDQIKAHINEDNYTKNQVDTLLNTKQDKLTAGNNITIEESDENLIISATDTTYTAGEGITIDNNVISASGGSIYTAGTGIEIESDEISVDDTVWTKNNLKSGKNVLIEKHINPNVITENTVMLLHCDGNSYNVIGDGNTNILTGASYNQSAPNGFGTSAKLNYGVIGYNGWGIDSESDFTFDARIKMSSNCAASLLDGTNAKNMGFYVVSDTEIRLLGGSDSAILKTITGTGFTGWNHIAFERENRTLRAYLNGSLIYTYEGINSYSKGLIYGWGRTSGTVYGDEFRFTNIALYKGESYTVPTEAYTTDGGPEYYEINASGLATTIQLASKQDTLTAGSNITINNNVISAIDTTYTAGTGVDITSNAISTVYPTYTSTNLIAGDNVTITSVLQPIIDAQTLALWNFDTNVPLKDVIGGTMDFCSSYSTYISFDSSVHKFNTGKSLKINGGSQTSNQFTQINAQNLPSTDWTLDGWFNKINNNSRGGFGPMSYSSSSYYGTGIRLYDGEFIVVVNSSTVKTLTASNGWHHLVVQHKATNDVLQFFIDGALVHSVQGVTSTSYSIYGLVDGYYLNVDEIRLSNAVRFPDAGFTPFTEPYSNDVDPKYQINATGGSSFDPTAITGYDVTKKQELFNENGTLKWKTRKIGYTNFLQNYNYIQANSACPASYSSMEQIIKVSICQQIDISANSQGITDSSTGNSVVGIGAHSNQSDKFKLYDGSNQVGTSSITENLQTYWIRLVGSGSSNCTLYTLIDNDGTYTIDTLPNLSQFTEETSSTNFTLANKYFRVGVKGPDNATKMTVYEVKLKIDNVTLFDLQDPSGYKVYGNVRTLYWYE